MVKTRMRHSKLLMLGLLLAFVFSMGMTTTANAADLIPLAAASGDSLFGALELVTSNDSLLPDGSKVYSHSREVNSGDHLISLDIPKEADVVTKISIDLASVSAALSMDIVSLDNTGLTALTMSLLSRDKVWAVASTDKKGILPNTNDWLEFNSSVKVKFNETSVAAYLIRLYDKADEGKINTPNDDAADSCDYWLMKVTSSDARTGNDILTFEVPGEAQSADISGTSVKAYLPAGSSISKWQPTFTLSSGAKAYITIDGTDNLQTSGTQESGITSFAMPMTVTYKITSENGINKMWNVTVEQVELNTSADLLSLSTVEQVGETKVDGTSFDLVVTFSQFRDHSNDIALSYDISPRAQLEIDGTLVSTPKVKTALDFSKVATKTFKVTSETGTLSKEYKVTLKGAPASTEGNFLNYDIVSDDNGALTSAKNMNTLNSKDHKVEIFLPYNADMDSLVASFDATPGVISVKVDDVAQTSKVTKNDFSLTNGVMLYSIAPEKVGVTPVIWTVNVKKLDLQVSNDLTAFSIAKQIGDTVIDSEKKTVKVTMPKDTVLTALVPTFSVSTFASARIGDTAQTSGVTSNDFTADVTYTVRSQSGLDQDWIVTVTTSEVKSSAKDITSFTVANQVGSTVISGDTVSVTMPLGTDLTALVASFDLSAGATAKVGDVAQVSGTTANDFTSPVTYVVTAEDETTKNWTVTVANVKEVTKEDVDKVAISSDKVELGTATMMTSEELATYTNANADLQKAFDDGKVDAILGLKMTSGTTSFDLAGIKVEKMVVAYDGADAVTPVIAQLKNVSADVMNFDLSLSSADVAALMAKEETVTMTFKFKFATSADQVVLFNDRNLVAEGVAKMDGEYLVLTVTNKGTGFTFNDLKGSLFEVASKDTMVAMTLADINDKVYTAAELEQYAKNLGIEGYNTANFDKYKTAINKEIDDNGSIATVAKLQDIITATNGGGSSSGGGCSVGFAPAALLLALPMFFLKR